MANDVPVVIVGGGLAGISTARSLAEIGLESLVIEAGRIGRGLDRGPNQMLGGTAGPRYSDYSKMANRYAILDTDFYSFERMHGDEGVSLDIEASIKGLEIMKNRGSGLGNTQPAVCESNGLVVANKGKVRELETAIQKLRSIGHACFTRLSRDEMREMFGITTFERGYLIPGECLVAQDAYINIQVNHPKIAKSEHTLVTRIDETKDGVTVSTSNGDTIRADRVFITTNGFMQLDGLKGTLKPEWSYILVFDYDGADLPNIWTFSKNPLYFTVRDRKLIFGGRDFPVVGNNFGTPNGEIHAITGLSKSASRIFPRIREQGLMPKDTHFGVFAYSKDLRQIVGVQSGAERVYLNMICNGWGFPKISYSSDMLARQIAHREMTAFDKRYAEFASARRFETLTRAT